MSDDQSLLSRRNALKCMAYGGAGTLFALSGGVFTPIDLAMAASDKQGAAKLGKPLFVQISDTHIGFNKEANPDVSGTLTQTIDIVNEMSDQPALIIHTGDITHLSKPAEFDLAQQLFTRLRTTEMHTVPGEHDTTDATVTEYFNRFGKASDNKGYYSFDHAGVHFIGLINVLQFKPGGLGTLGADQLAWVAADLQGRSSSTPIVQKVEGNMTFHTARSTSYPQPAAGVGSGPGPLKVPSDQLAAMLGITSVSVVKHPSALALNDTALA